MSVSRQRQKAGIVAVAQLAGVATSTVSRILAGGKLALAFSPETQKRVMAAAEQLHYVPNSHARRLVRGRADHVALITRSPAIPFFGELVDHFTRVFSEFHIRVSVDVADVNEEEIMAAIRKFDGDLVDAIFVCPSDASMSFENKGSVRCPIISLIYTSASAAMPYVAFDVRDAAKQATAHLIRGGKQRIGYVGPTHENDGRMSGYLEAMREAGLKINPAIVFSDNFFQIDRAHEVGEKLKIAGQHADALYVASDLNAIGVIHGLVQAGFSVPEDVVIASHDGIRLGEYYRPALTTMAVPWHPMIEHCATMVKAIHEGVTPQGLLNLSRTLKSTLRVRESCGQNPSGATGVPAATNANDFHFSKPHTTHH